MHPRVITLIIAAVSLAAPAFAQSASDHVAHHPKPAAADAAEGEVKKVDKSAGKVTIKHDEIPNLEMPAMTMVFRVKERAMLDSLKEGDKVRFTADKVKGIYTVTAVEVVK